MAGIAVGMKGTEDQPCSDLRGLWRSSLGSEMFIRQDDDFHITGEYTSAVESREGVKKLPAPLAGVVKPLEEGSLVSWNVLWSGGKSMTTWVGQCTMQGAASKTIFATWLLKTMESDPGKKWVSNRIHQDTFWRVTPLDNFKPPPLNLEQVGENEGLVGRWNSVSEDAFRIDVAAKTGSVFGVHLTPDGISGESPRDLVGLTNYEKECVAVAFSAAGLHEIKGWAGFIYDPEGLGEDPHPPVLETSWISHRFSQKLAQPRRFVKFGMDDYKMDSSTSEQEPVSPTKKMKQVVEVELD